MNTARKTGKLLSSTVEARPSMATSALLALLVASSIRSVRSASGYTYPFSFFNITVPVGGVDPIGNVEIYVCSINATESYLSLRNKEYNGFAETTISLGIKTVVNLTLDYNQLRVSGEPALPNQVAIFPYGLMVSAEDEIFVYAVKSDQGTTDGYLVSVLTNYSKEFFIAGWPVERGSDLFYTGIMVISAFSDTCVDVWNVTAVTTYDQASGQNVTSLKYDYLTGFYMYQRYWFGMLSVDGDPTGLYVNASRPVTVISGVSCGRVPIETNFCDHMAEIVPGISELGTTHVVPPIYGRSASAGYLVRVVPTKLQTTVTWSTATDLLGTTVVNAGNFQEIDITDATTILLIVCSEPCVVMQYNKGNKATTNETTFTDPFMTLITPVERYITHSCFGTAIMSVDKNVNIDFDNWLGLATLTSNIDSIYIDGYSVSSDLWRPIGIYSVATQRIKPGFHSVFTTSSAKFGGWLYGHSPLETTTSAYGYPIGYKTYGSLTEETWSEFVSIRQSNTEQERINVCQYPIATNGLGVTSYLSDLGAFWTLYDPIQLEAFTSVGVAITSDCVELYRKALQSTVTNAVRYINYQICAKSMCPFMTGDNEGIVIDDGDVATGVEKTTMFVAINASSVASNIILDVNSNILTAVHIKIQFAGILDTNAEAYALCRGEIRDFLLPFVNWMTLSNNGYVPATAASLSSSSQAALSQIQKDLLANKQFVAAPASCPALSFSTDRFTYSTNVC